MERDEWRNLGLGGVGAGPTAAVSERANKEPPPSGIKK